MHRLGYRCRVQAAKQEFLVSRGPDQVFDGINGSMAPWLPGHGCLILFGTSVDNAKRRSYREALRLAEGRGAS